MTRALPASILVLLLCPLLGCPPPPPPPPIDHEPVRFIALGDTGEGNEAQYDVAEAMAAVCADQGCDFVLLLGDNIYESGVNALDDLQWQEKFELPYAGLDLPFYAVLGNHDYGLLVPSNDRAEFQVAYTDVSDKWIMPARHYSHRHSNVEFVALDTQATQFPGSLGPELEAQDRWLKDLLAQDREGAWRIVYGHHPYVSNGLHGNAGAYDGFPPELDLSGIHLKRLFDEHICGSADLYLCGHDHDREWLEQRCGGTRFVVSGAGAKLRPIEDVQPAHFGDYQFEGFTWFEIVDDELTLQFWNRYGELDYENGWNRRE